MTKEGIKAALIAADEALNAYYKEPSDDNATAEEVKARRALGKQLRAEREAAHKNWLRANEQAA